MHYFLKIKQILFLLSYLNTIYTLYKVNKIIEAYKVKFYSLNNIQFIFSKCITLNPVGRSS